MKKNKENYTNMTTEIDEKMYEESAKLANELSIRIVTIFSNEIKKIAPADLVSLDSEHDYFFTLQIMGSFLKEMAYSLEIYSMMRQKPFPAEKVIDIVKEIALELMKDKKSDFQKIFDGVISQVAKEGTRASKH